MARRDSKNEIRLRIHKRIRHKLQGTEQRPRLAVFRSLGHIYAQIIDDSKGHTVVAASSNEKGGVNGGAGIAFRLGSSHAKVFAEARYHHANTIGIVQEDQSFFAGKSSAKSSEAR